MVATLLIKTVRSPQVVIVNETFARTFFPNEINRSKTSVMRRGSQATASEIVGVVRDSKYLSG
jgi:hypothetical protein